VDKRCWKNTHPMASTTATIAAAVAAVASETTSSLPESSTPAQGNIESAGQGISGGTSFFISVSRSRADLLGYNGDSLSLKIILAFLIGLALYNSIELIVLILATFNKYKGLYFWSLIIASVGIIPYSVGFLIKFFQLLDPNQDVGYVAVVMLTVGWYAMITGII
jgi:hypothetical protein